MFTHATVLPAGHSLARWFHHCQNVKASVLFGCENEAKKERAEDLKKKQGQRGRRPVLGVKNGTVFEFSFKEKRTKGFQTWGQKWGRFLNQI